MLPGWIGCVPEGTLARLACVEQRVGQRPVVHWVQSPDFAQPAQALRQLKRQRRLGRHRRVALLPRGQYQVLPLEAPDLPREDWKAALRWQLKGLVDFPVEQAAIDLLELPAAASRGGAARVLAVAAAPQALQPLARPAEDAGVPWTAIDIPETALRNLSALVEPPGRAQALLHIAQAGAQLVITFGGELLLARGIEIASAALDQADAELRSAAFDRAGLELQRTLDSFERQFSAATLARLLVAPAAGAEAFCAHLRELLYVPVEPLDLAEQFDLAAVPELAEPSVFGQYLAAIGAALREH